VSQHKFNKEIYVESIVSRKKKLYMNTINLSVMICMYNTYFPKQRVYYYGLVTILLSYLPFHLLNRNTCVLWIVWLCEEIYPKKISII